MNWWLFAFACVVAFGGTTGWACKAGAQVGWMLARRALTGGSTPIAEIRGFTVEEQDRWDTLASQLDRLDRELAVVLRARERLDIGDSGPGAKVREREAQLRDRRLAVWQEARALAESALS